AGWRVSFGSSASPATVPKTTLHLKRRRSTPRSVPTMAKSSSRDSSSSLLVSWRDSEDRDHLWMISLGVDDQGTRTAAEPTRVLVFADEYSGMLLPIAVFDPDRLAFLEFLGRLAHRVRLARE